MAKRPPNPYTKYGRRRHREEIYQHKASLSPEERAKESEFEGCLYIVIVGIIVLLIFIFGGSGTALKWLSH